MAENHKELSDKLLLLVDGQLPLDEASRLRGHVDGCDECRTEVKQLEQTVQTLRRAYRLVRSHPAVEDVVLFAEHSADLSSERKAAVEAHLPSCPECREHVSLLQEELAGNRGEDVPEIMPSALRKAIAEVSEAAGRKVGPAEGTPVVLLNGGRPKAWRSPRWILSVAASALILIALGLALLPRSGRENVSQAPGSTRVAVAGSAASSVPAPKDKVVAMKGPTEGRRDLPPRPADQEHESTSVQTPSGVPRPSPLAGYVAPPSQTAEKTLPPSKTRHEESTGLGRSPEGQGRSPAGLERSPEGQGRSPAAGGQGRSHEGQGRGPVAEPGSVPVTASSPGSRRVDGPVGGTRLPAGNPPPAAAPVVAGSSVGIAGKPASPPMTSAESKDFIKNLPASRAAASEEARKEVHASDGTLAKATKDDELAGNKTEAVAKGGDKSGDLAGASPSTGDLSRGAASTPIGSPQGHGCAGVGSGGAGGSSGIAGSAPSQNPVAPGGASAGGGAGSGAVPQNQVASASASNVDNRGRLGNDEDLKTRNATDAGSSTLRGQVAQPQAQAFQQTLASQQGAALQKPGSMKKSQAPARDLQTLRSRAARTIARTLNSHSFDVIVSPGNGPHQEAVSVTLRAGTSLSARQEGLLKSSLQKDLELNSSRLIDVQVASSSAPSSTMRAIVRPPAVPPPPKASATP